MGGQFLLSVKSIIYLFIKAQYLFFISGIKSVTRSCLFYVKYFILNIFAIPSVSIITTLVPMLSSFICTLERCFVDSPNPVLLHLCECCLLPQGEVAFAQHGTHTWHELVPAFVYSLTFVLLSHWMASSHTPWCSVVNSFPNSFELLCLLPSLPQCMCLHLRLNVCYGIYYTFSIS